MADLLTPRLRLKFQKILGGGEEDTPEIGPLPAASPAPVEAQRPIEPAPVEEDRPILPTPQPSAIIQQPEQPAPKPEEELKLKALKIGGLLQSPGEFAPEEPKDPTRSWLEQKAVELTEKNPALNDIPAVFFIKNGRLPTREDFSPQTQDKLTRIENDPNAWGSLDDDEKTYLEKWRQGLTKLPTDILRAATRPDNAVNVLNRFGAGVAKGFSATIVDTEQKAREQVDHLGEEWVKESVLPELTGEVAGTVLGFGPVASAVGGLVKTGGLVLGRFGTFLFGAQAKIAAEAAISATRAVEESSAAAKVAVGVVKGAASEAPIGAAFGLARDPKEGETRIQNAWDDALLFAGFGGAIQGFGAYRQFAKDARLSEAVTKFADSIGVSKEEAEFILKAKNPSAEKFSDLAPELINKVNPEEIKGAVDQLKTNRGIVKLAEEQDISLFEAFDQVRAKNPEIPLNKKLFEQIKDTELATAPYKDFIDKYVVTEQRGRNVSPLTSKLLERAGEWLYNPEGINLFGKTIPGSKGFRDFLVGEATPSRDRLFETINQNNQEANALVRKNLDLVKKTGEQIDRLAAERGVSREAANKRITQIVQSRSPGVTTDAALEDLRQDYQRLHDPLETRIREDHELFDKSKFIQLSRKEVAELVNQKESLIQKFTKSVESPELQKSLAKTLREKEFESADEMKGYLKKTLGSEADLSDAELLYDKSRFIRSNYRNAGLQHLSRFYMVHEEGRKAALGFFLKNEVRPQNRARFREQLDLPAHVRKEMGEIEDLQFRIGKTINSQIEAVQKGDNLLAVARDPMLAKPIKIAGKINPEAQGKIAEGWTQIPDSESWGALRNHAVSPQVVNDLKTMGIRMNGENPVVNRIKEIHRSTLRLWKTGKVLPNPVTHLNQIFSNSIMGDLSGFSFLRQARILPKAAYELARPGDWTTLAKKHGVFGTDNEVSFEIRKILSNAMKEKENHVEGFLSYFSKIGEKSTLVNMIKKGTANLGAIYQAEDQVFKLGKFMDLVERGYRPEVAAAEAEKWYFNYAKIPHSIRIAKEYFSPFITYTSKAIPRFYESIIESPWKLAKYGIVMNGLNNLSLAIQEGDDLPPGSLKTMLDFVPDDLKRETFTQPQYKNDRISADWQRTKLSSLGIPLGLMPKSMAEAMEKNGLTLPRMLRVPFVKDKWGREQLVDMAYRLPWGDFTDTAKHSALNIPNTLLPSGPVWDLYHAWRFNEDPFTKKKIALNENDPLRGKKYMDYYARLLFPSLAPGGYSWDKIVAGYEEHKDWDGRVRTLKVALFDALLGLKVRPFDAATEKSFRMDELDKELTEIDDYLKQLDEDVSNKKVSPKKRDEEAAAYMKRIREIGKQYGVISSFGDKK